MMKLGAAAMGDVDGVRLEDWECRADRTYLPLSHPTVSFDSSDAALQ